MLVNLTHNEIQNILDAIMCLQHEREETSYYGPISPVPHLYSAEKKLRKVIKE